MPANPRFAEVWEMDPAWRGLDVQDQAIYDTFELVYGSVQHRLMKELDRSTNQVYHRSALRIGFKPQSMFGPWQLAVAAPTGIAFTDQMSPSGLPGLLWHETGHIVDFHLMTHVRRSWFMTELNVDPETNTWNRNLQETFADAVRDWMQGTGWPALGDLLLP